MKQPKKLSLNLKLAASAYGLNPKEYMLQVDGDTYVTLVHKKTGDTKIIDKYARPRKGARV